MPAPRLRGRFFVEITLGTLSPALLLLTLAWSNWVEMVFNVDPDHGNSSFEYLISAGLLVAAAWSGWLARSAWRRYQAARRPTYCPSRGSRRATTRP